MKRSLELILLSVPALAAWALTPNAAVAAETLDLNGEWSLAVGGKPARRVSVPHTWNVDLGDADYRGKAVYEREIGDVSAQKGKTARIRFESVYHTADVSVNGKRVGSHVGGYTPFSFDVTDALDFAPGAANRIRVEVDNTQIECNFPSKTSYDWACDGGIYRPVSMRFTDGPGIRYVHLDPVLATGEVKVEVKLWDGTVSNSSFKVDHPIPWHFDRPHLYSHTVKAGGDEMTVRYGFRELKVLPDGFLFNGEKVRLAGIESMPGSNPAYGMAEPPEYQRQAMGMIRRTNATLTRFHWVQPEATLDACDELGVLVQEELSWWGNQPKRLDPAQAALAGRLVEEMVEAHYNHPSVVIWGLSNEVQGNDEDLQTLAALVRRLNPARLVDSICNDTHTALSNASCYRFDLPTWNDYVGTWYHSGRKEMLPGLLDAIGAGAANRPLLITEAGVCEPSFAGGDVRRIDEMLYHFAEWRKRPFVIGCIYFCLNDYRTDIGEEGIGANRIRRHGIADKLLAPKASFDVFSTLISPVEIAEVKATGADHGTVRVSLRVRDTIPAYSVRGYSLRYANREGKQIVLPVPETKPGETRSFEIDDINGEYKFQVCRPDGGICVEY